MFEWFGGCLWSGNDAARIRFDVGAIEDKLPLSQETKQRLDELSTLHQQALNQEYPPEPGPWTSEDYQRFETEALSILRIVQIELGPEFEVVYEPL